MEPNCRRLLLVGRAEVEIRTPGGDARHGSIHDQNILGHTPQPTAALFSWPWSSGPATRLAGVAQGS
jgi:hypothetical protein